MSIQKTYINKIDAINYPILPKEYRKYPTMNLDDAYEKGWTDLQELLSNQVEENVVEVIRCKDCKHYKTMFCKMDVWHKDITLYRADENDFCSYGEQKDG